MADEELAVQLLFQIGDVGAQGLLGDVESIGGFCEAALLGGHEKVVHGKKVHIKPPEYKKESLIVSVVQSLGSAVLTIKDMGQPE